MKITTVWIKYRDSYPGEYAPNLHAAVDEWLHDDNPDYLKSEIDKARQMLARGEIEDYSVADIEVADAWVRGLFERQSTEATPVGTSGL